MGEAQLLERITLDRQAISFNRMYTTSVLFTTTGINALNCFIYPAATASWWWITSTTPPVRGDYLSFRPSVCTKCRSIIAIKILITAPPCIEQSVVESALSAFPRHQAQFAALAASNLPAQIYDPSEHAAFIERIPEQFQRLESTGQTTACEVAFLMMQLNDVSTRAAAPLPAAPADRCPRGL